MSSGDNNGADVVKWKDPSTLDQDMVVVRYFLDRPGHNVKGASVRLWKKPPSIGTPQDFQSFLISQGIVDDVASSSLLVEVYIERFQGYMLLDVCEKEGIQFEFNHTKEYVIRLTDENSTGAVGGDKSSYVFGACNTSPITLFIFSITTAMQMMDLMYRLIPGSIDEAFYLTYGPYSFWICGWLQFVCGILEAFRHNIYGATALTIFGSLWMGIGTKTILMNFFATNVDQDMKYGSDRLGDCLLSVWIASFIGTLVYQTLTITKLTTLLMSLLFVMNIAIAFSGYSEALMWVELVVGWTLAAVTFYAFVAELTNEVYNGAIIPTFPWKDADETFAAAGKMKQLENKQGAKRTSDETPEKKSEPSVHGVRSAGQLQRT